MSVFFFTVGLEIKHELRHGSLASMGGAAPVHGGARRDDHADGRVRDRAARDARRLDGAIAVPMATDIAFALGVLGFRTKMPAAATAFLLTLATVDDLGAILVLATCFAKNRDALPRRRRRAATLTAIGRSGSSDIKPFAVGGVAMWWFSSARRRRRHRRRRRRPLHLDERVRRPPAATPARPARPPRRPRCRPRRPPLPHALLPPPPRPSPPHPPSLLPPPGSCRIRGDALRGCSAARAISPSSSCRSLRSLPAMKAGAPPPARRPAAPRRPRRRRRAARWRRASGSGCSSGSRSASWLLAALAETGPRVPLEGDESRAPRDRRPPRRHRLHHALLLTEVAITGPTQALRSSPS